MSSKVREQQKILQQMTMVQLLMLLASELFLAMSQRWVYLSNLKTRVELRQLFRSLFPHLSCGKQMNRPRVGSYGSVNLNPSLRFLYSSNSSSRILGARIYYSRYLLVCLILKSLLKEAKPKLRQGGMKSKRQLSNSTIRSFQRHFLFLPI
jgi:hypothetical protein